MIEWHDMDSDPPGKEYLGRYIILSAVPAYGPAYTVPILWLGPSPRKWPVVTHWSPMPPPAWDMEVKPDEKPV